MLPDKIQYLRHDEINRSKWDHCIETAANGLIYGYSYYLDNMSSQWDALIMNDYEAIMPLTWNKKWGIRYLYQPPFTPQLGIFSPKPVSPALVDDFLSVSMNDFGFAEIFLNHFNANARYTSEHCNLIIHLNQPFDVLEKGFKADLLKNVCRAKKFELKYLPTEDYKAAIQLFQEFSAVTLPHVTDAHYKHFEEVCRIALENKQLVIRKVEGADNELLAITLFLKDDHRMYNLMSTTLPNGRTLEANHVLMYEFIKEYAGQPLILDLEGSDIDGIARFYKKFGAIQEPYYFFRFNRLPRPFKWLKPS